MVTIVESAPVMAFHCLIAGDWAEVIATLSMKAIWSVVARPRSSTVWAPLATVNAGVVSGAEFWLRGRSVATETPSMNTPIDCVFAADTRRWAAERESV